MNNKRIIQTVGIWKFLIWLFYNKVLKKQMSIGISLIICEGYGIREYIDHEGNYKITTVK